MSSGLMFVAGCAVGCGVGFLVAHLLITAKPSDCCARVASGVRAAVAEKSSIAVAFGDLFGLWSSTPAVLERLGVPT